MTLAGIAAVALAGCGGGARTALPPTTTLAPPQHLSASTGNGPSGGSSSDGGTPATTVAPAVVAGTTTHQASAAGSSGAGHTSTGHTSTGQASTGQTTPTTVAPLSLTSQTVEGVTFAVPAGWTQVDEESPGDWTGLVFQSPTDPGAQLVVIVDRCAQCVTDGPVSMIGGGSDIANVHQVNADQAVFTMTDRAASLGTGDLTGSGPLASGYATDGLSVIDPNVPAGQNIAPSGVAAVTLPASHHADATRILNGLHIG